MTFSIHTSGAPKAAIDEVVPRLVGDLVASRITAFDSTLWGAAAEEEAAKRLGWVEAVSVSRPLVDEIVALRDELRAQGVHRVVLAGMGGSSLAPEVIAQTAGVPLTILDSTAPGQVLAALDDNLAETVLVVSSKSGSTVETDSQRRTFEAAFRDIGVDPVERIVVVTDPGSPLDASARETGYRVFNADPNVGGRYSALTAFGLVPSGLAGVDIGELLDEAEATLLQVAIDQADNPALRLAAAIAATNPRRDKMGLVTDGTHIVGLPDWIEQLIAESTGKEGTGILPVVLLPVSPELESLPADLQIVRLVDDANEFHLHERHQGEILVSGSLGANFIVWEYATAIAGHLLGINPFDQPDVESAKIAARGLLDARPEPTAPAFVQNGIEVRVTDPVLAASGDIESGHGCPLGPAPRRRLRVHPGLCEPSRAAAAAGAARTRRRRLGPADDVRLGTAIPALHRPISQGRARTGGIPADPRAHRGRSRDPRQPLHLRTADPGAGHRRRGCARRSRSARGHAHDHG